MEDDVTHNSVQQRDSPQRGIVHKGCIVTLLMNTKNAPVVNHLPPVYVEMDAKGVWMHNMCNCVDV